MSKDETFKRYLTAIILIPIVVFLIFIANPFQFSFVILLVLILGLSEIFKMLELKGIKPIKIQAYLYLAVFIFMFCKSGFSHLPLLLFLMLFTILTQKVIKIGELDRVMIDVSATFLSILYFAFLGGFLVMIRCFEGQSGQKLIILFLAIIWIGDTAAMHIGKAFGVRKLSHLSPNKTVEGAIAGAIGSILGAIIFKIITQLNIPFRHTILLGFIVGVVGQIGDLIESMFKRSVRLKDSGTIFPGHGGAMDRIDSLLFGAPAFFLYLKYILKWQ